MEKNASFTFTEFAAATTMSTTGQSFTPKRKKTASPRLYGKEGSAMSDFTTMEHLQERVSSYGAVLRYNDKVFVTDITHTGQFRASIYEFVDKPGVDFDEIECRLFLVDTSHKTFEDAGHAIAWCLRKK